MIDLRLVLHPKPELGRVDTSLRYTDILFGFVIRELFLRLQNWSQLTDSVRWHLVVGTTLVLGSWIGYRRSQNRTTYEVKFFNLPLFRFLVDQLMLILYFRIAVLTEVDGHGLPTDSDLAASTINLVMYVFVLYVVWDLFGIWMARSMTKGSTPRYPQVVDGKMSEGAQPADWVGFFISTSVLAVFAVLWCRANVFDPQGLFVLVVLLLLTYRMAKEIRTSWRS